LATHEQQPDKKTPSSELVSAAAVKRRILFIRNRQVMLDAGLAELYGVETKVLTRAVRRNQERFPKDFMFQLSRNEFDDLRSQTGTSSGQHGGRRYAPYVFTEHGVAMLSSVLRSRRAAAVNVEIMRTFVELRRIAQSHTELAQRVDELEREVAAKLGKHDKELAAIFEVLRKVTLSKPRKRPAGFVPPGNG
jgi:hypothetical protein